jgi:hypothetical protein
MAATSSPTSICQQQHGDNSASNNGNTESQAQSDVCKQDDDDNDEVQRATSNDELHSNCVQPLINTGPTSNAQLPHKQPTNICQTSNDHYDVATDNDHYDLPAEYSRTSIDQLWHNTVDENNRSASLNTDNRPKLLKGDRLNQGTAALFESPASVSPALRTAMSQSDAVSSSVLTNSKFSITNRKTKWPQRLFVHFSYGENKVLIIGSYSIRPRPLSIN